MPTTLSIQKLIAKLAMISLSIVMVAGCTDSNFAGSSGKNKPAKKCAKPPCKDNPPPTPPHMDPSEFSGEKSIEPIQNTKIWTVTVAGAAKRWVIDGDSAKVDVVVPLALYGDSGPFGFRSYVTEGGLLGARSPYLWFIDPLNPAAVKKKSLGIDKNSRICVASYMKDGKRYMIAAYGNGNFVEYPMDDKPPYAPLWDGPPSKQASIGLSGSWGYSCFIDQQQKIFYSQHTAIGAINLMNFANVTTPGTAANAGFSSSTPGVQAYTNSTQQRGAYALSGDSYGNVYNHVVDGAANGYTAAHDKASDTVWFSHRAGARVGKIAIIDRKCLTTLASCPSDRFWLDYQPTYNGVPVSIGPMSALKDGRVVGLVRSTGDIYLMSLTDKTKPKSGFNMVKIGSAGGDPYMYTDFTGATLYINESEQTFKPSEMEKYQPSKPLKVAVFKWTPTTAAMNGGLSVEWKNIKLEARCYSNPQGKPAYEEVAPISSSDKLTVLNVSTCGEGNYDYLDVKLTQLNSDSTLMGIDKINVGFKQ